MFEGIRHPILFFALPLSMVFGASAVSGGDAGVFYIACIVWVIGIVLYLAREESSEEAD